MTERRAPAKWNDTGRRRILSIDPGLRATGVALIADDKLRFCGLARSKNSGTGEPDVYGAFEVAARAAALCSAAVLDMPVDLVVIEWPRVRDNGEEDPNDLLLLTFVHGLILERLFAEKILEGVRIAPVSADRWTSGLKKGIRQLNFIETLDAEEFAILDQIEPESLRHNVTDSVHLGKWASFAPRFKSLCRDSTPGARLPAKREK